MLRDLFSLFPAYAGVILFFVVYLAVYATFPRIRGGDPREWQEHMSNTAFSPHTRG